MKSKVRFGILGAFVALAGAFGAVSSHKAADQVDAQVPPLFTVAKTCTATQVAINGNSTCTVTVTATAPASFIEPLVLTVSPGLTGAGANGAYGRARLVNGTSGATGNDVDFVNVANPADGSTQTITIGCTGVAVGQPAGTVPNGGTCDFAAGDTIVITEGLQGVVGGPTTESIKFGAGVAVALSPTVTVSPAAVAATAVCTPAAIVAGSGVLAVPVVSNCVITFSDNDAFPTTVSSSNIIVTLTGPNGVVIQTTGTTTASFNCGGAFNAPQSCTSITVPIVSNTANVSGPVTLQVNYAPDLPAVDFPIVLTLTNVLAVNLAPVNIVALIQPAGLRILCTSVLDSLAPQTVPIQLPTPAQITAANLIAIGTLPATIPCTVVPIDAAGNVLAAVAPGVISVSSTGGVIVTGIGTIAADVPIGCDAGLIAPVVVVPGATVNGNVCTGVAFRVAGLGVGNIELRARYLPSSASVAAGIQERDTTASVGFVAPFVGVSLLLNPNPIAANGGTGVATARLNRSFNCSVAFGQTIQGGTACIDPTTGLPIVFNFGSALNGTVLYNIDNTAVAVWADAVSSTVLSAPQTAGFIATAAQTSKRCGLFPTAGFPNTQVTFPSFTGNLQNYFGGCESTTATYRGVLPGTTNITASFVPDLPGAFGTSLGLTNPVSALFGQFGAPGSFSTSTRVLEVVAPAPSGAVQLSRGCNNVSPTVSEAAAAYAARVTPQGALVAIWEHQAATNTFRGFSPQAGAPSDLAAVTRLRPVFVCVSAAATLDQPAA